MERTLRARAWLMASMVVGVATMRLIPHPPNFAPVAAMALFGGAHFDRKAWAFAVPLAAMAISDAALELMFGRGFHAQMPVVYICFAAIVCLGFLLRRRRHVASVAGAALASSTLFFLTTNLGVWQTGGLYPRTVAGLAACYVAAIPFFWLTLAGDLAYSALLFGAFAVAERRYPIFALQKTP
jgi:uncharacterized protein DUF6580